MECYLIYFDGHSTDSIKYRDGACDIRQCYETIRIKRTVPPTPQKKNNF
ncbi:hypothetical protein [Candidatus Enterovibrio altilux]